MQNDDLDESRARLFTRFFRSRVLSARWIPTIWGEGHENALRLNDLHTERHWATIQLGFLLNSLRSNEPGWNVRANLNRSFICASKGDTSPLLEGTNKTNLQERPASSAYHRRKLSTTLVSEAQLGGYGAEIRFHAEEVLRGDGTSWAWEVRPWGVQPTSNHIFYPKALDNTSAWVENTVVLLQLQAVLNE